MQTIHFLQSVFLKMHMTKNSVTEKSTPFIIQEPDPQQVQARRFTRLVFITDLILVNVAFFVMNYIKRDSLELSEIYLKLFVLFHATWLAISLLIRKFNLNAYLNYKNAMMLLARSNVYILFTLSLAIVLMGLYAFSRIQVFGACLLLFLLEAAVFTAFYFIYGKQLMESHHGPAGSIRKYADFSIYLLFADYLLLIASFFAVNYWKRGSFALIEDYEQIILLLSSIWLTVSVLTRKFERLHYRNIYYFLAPHVKAFLIMFALTAATVFALRMFEFSRTQIFGTLVLFVAVELPVYYIYFMNRRHRRAASDIETVEDVQKILTSEELPLELEKILLLKNREVISIREKLKERFLKNFPGLYHFIEQNIDLDIIDESDSVVMNTHNLYNIETLDDHSKSLIINLHKINDMRWLNRYFLQVHRKIYNGGYLIGRAHTLTTHKEWFYRKFPKLIANLLYPLDFIFRRVMPKLPVFKTIYFMITKGHNRALSKAEILGRLYFCGYRVNAVTELEGSFIFIAQRIKNPSLDTNPSYGPTIRLKRVGLGGKIIYTRKFRTMHPYSEYLQEYIYENYHLQPNGKFNDDIRVTTWGKWFRKLWIDELPQLINFFQGELNLVGVRALSQHYFSLYPKELQELRIQFKPGLVPPYYADMPKSFEEIVASEKKYLLAKKAHPLTTDLKYFFKAMYNIFFRNARSN